MFRLFLLLSCVAVAQAQSPDTSDWGYYGGDTFGQRYSSLAQINRDNIARLTVAWEFRTGELGEGFASAGKLAFEATPVLAFSLLYLATPTDIVIALDPATGAQRWRYDPRISRKRNYSEAASRGVGVWEDRTVTPGQPCSRRVFIGTLDARLIALDAATGKRCADFGAAGVVNLTAGAISPPVLYDGRVIVGSAAFDARTGAPRWAFDSEPGAWAVMSLDPDRGLVFVPTGSASHNRFANSLLALDARTGKMVWHQQLVHDDLWSFDVAAQPVAAELELQGTLRSAVLQATKSGMLFVFERDTGLPIFPVLEQNVPQSRTRGERASSTQPFSVLPPLVNQAPLKPRDAWGITFWDRAKCRDLIASHRSEGIFTPPDERGAILSPGDLGGVNWGGIAFDARHQRVYAAVNHVPTLATPTHHEPLVSPWGLPCIAPPWGSLVSIDLLTSQIVWQVPLGSNKAWGPWFAPRRDFGTPNLGGPIVTAGDLVFVGAAMDNYIRAFDLETGRELWKHRLPAGGQATPMTYRAGSDHRQFVVIAAGGHGLLGTRRGDSVVAFALPTKRK